MATQAVDYDFDVDEEENDSEAASRIVGNFRAKCEGRELNFPIYARVNTIGRGAECDIRVLSGGLSSTHAQLDAREDGEWSFEDLGSRNGSFKVKTGAKAKRMQAQKVYEVSLGQSLYLANALCTLQEPAEEVGGGPGQDFPPVDEDASTEVFESNEDQPAPEPAAPPPAATAVFDPDEEDNKGAGGAAEEGPTGAAAVTATAVFDPDEEDAVNGAREAPKAVDATVMFDPDEYDDNDAAPNAANLATAATAVFDPDAEDVKPQSHRTTATTTTAPTQIYDPDNRPTQVYDPDSNRPAATAATAVFEPDEAADEAADEAGEEDAQPQAAAVGPTAATAIFEPDDDARSAADVEEDKPETDKAAGEAPSPTKAAGPAAGGDDDADTEPATENADEDGADGKEPDLSPELDGFAARKIKTVDSDEENSTEPGDAEPKPPGGPKTPEAAKPPPDVASPVIGIPDDSLGRNAHDSKGHEGETQQSEPAATTKPKRTLPFSFARKSNSAPSREPSDPKPASPPEPTSTEALPPSTPEHRGKARESAPAEKKSDVEAGDAMDVDPPAAAAPAKESEEAQPKHEEEKSAKEEDHDEEMKDHEEEPVIRRGARKRANRLIESDSLGDVELPEPQKRPKRGVKDTPPKVRGTVVSGEAGGTPNRIHNVGDEPAPKAETKEDASEVKDTAAPARPDANEKVEVVFSESDDEPQKSSPPAPTRSKRKAPAAEPAAPNPKKTNRGKKAPPALEEASEAAENGADGSRNDKVEPATPQTTTGRRSTRGVADASVGPNDDRPAPARRTGRGAAKAAAPDKSPDVTPEKAEKPVPAKRGKRGRKAAEAAAEPKESPAPTRRGRPAKSDTPRDSPPEPVSKRRGRKEASPPQSSPTSSALQRHKDVLDHAPKFMFTGQMEGISDSELKKVKQSAQRLGGKVADTLESATILITDKVRRTMKFLEAICRGIPIVQIQWLQESIRTGHFLETDKYIIMDKAREKQWGFSLRKSLDSAKVKSSLAGMTVHVTSGVKPSAKEVKALLKVAGATVVDQWPKGGGAIVVSTEEESARWKAGPRVYAAELVFDGILTQQLKMDEAKIDGKPNLLRK